MAKKRPGPRASRKKSAAKKSPARKSPAKRSPAKPRAAEAKLKARLLRMQTQLGEAQETLDAIRKGQVDALVVEGPTGEQVFTLRGADHRYRQLVETMNEGAVLLSQDGTIVYCNARFASLVGRRLEDTLAAPLGRFLSPRWAASMSQLTRTSPGSTFKAEIEIERSDGAVVPVYLSATAIRGDEEDIVCVIVTDLSEQRRTQEVLAAERFAASILDQAAEAVVVCDVAGVVIRASQAAQLLAGENPLHRPFVQAFALVRASDLREVVDPVPFALAGRRLSGEEVRLRRHDGGEVDLLLSSGPVIDAGGRAVGCVASLIDVTQRRAAAAERLRLLEGAESAREAAESANRAKDEFLAMLGHELRNPLAPILTALELMRLRGDQSSMRERAVIERQVRHVVRLVDDLLDVSRITQGKVELDRKPLELADIVTKALEAAAPLIEQRQHRLSVSVPPTGLMLSGDSTRLCQVVANLLTNAAKYTDQHGHIWVRAARDGDAVVLTVADDGVGIPAEILPHLFDTFVQGQRTIDRSEGGLGLGLAIVRSMVLLHGGTVEVHSDGVGRGSQFEVRLPALQAGAAPAPRPTPPRAASTPLMRKRVLIVDDNVDAAELLAASLDVLGHATRVAYDGPSALNAAQEFAPEVALLDIGLPVMDGYELARRLRASFGRGTCLIAVTGYGQDTDRQRSADAGFDAHLVKPIEIDGLGQVIRKLTDAATPS